MAQELIWIKQSTVFPCIYFFIYYPFIINDQLFFLFRAQGLCVHISWKILNMRSKVP